MNDRKFILDNVRVIELVMVGAFVIYGAVVNAREVPAIKNELSETRARVTVLENRLIDIKESLARIEKAVAGR